MTPKDKAIELVEKYDEILTYLESKLKAKQCALIAIEELIKTFIPKNNKSYLCEEIEFWQEVKIEIEKL